MVALSQLVNAEFKARHPGYLRRALVAAVALHFLLFAFAPPFTSKPYRLPVVQEFVVEEIVEFTFPEPPPKVVVPDNLATCVDPGEDPVDIAEPSPDRFKEIAIDPKPPSATVAFLAYDEMPILINYTIPEYPTLAREAGLEGTVRVKIVVGRDGKVKSASILSSDVTPAMEQAAMEAAKRCTFKPARQRSIPVRATVMIPYKFRLNR
ncbi:MAG: energy transducer TonB [Candidatus Krumholzibacteria bacterium]